MDDLALCDAIFSCFSDNVPVADQPGYIVDTFCDNGLFLDKIYRFISDSPRGDTLEKNPVLLVGIVKDRRTLNEVENKLKNTPHLLIIAAANEPEKWLLELKKRVIEHSQNILMLAPYKNTIQTLDWSNFFQEFSDCFISYPPKIRIFLEHSNDLQSTTNSSSFWSRAETLLIQAANSGFFCIPNGISSPKDVSVCNARFFNFEKKDYKIRHAQMSDLGALYHLEKLCWQETLQTPKNKLEKRLSHDIHEQFVLEWQGEVVGVIYSQRILAIENIKQINAETVHCIQDVNGSIIQLIAVNIAPDFQQLKLGDALLEFMLQRCALILEVETVVAVTMCRDFYKYSASEMSTYIHQREENGWILDPILRFHESHGAEIIETIPRYRPLDVRNQGFGVLVLYDIKNRKRKQSAIKAENTVSHYNFDFKLFTEYLEDAIKKLLGREHLSAFDKNSSLMAMGLDSMDVMNLSEQMSGKFKIELSPIFFFQHNTYNRIAAYFKVLMHPNGKQVKHNTDRVSIKDNEQARQVNQSQLLADYEKNIKNNDIAIIGMSCRLPNGIDSPEDLWTLLKNGASVIGSLPEDRWDWPDEIDPHHKHLGIDKGGFLKDIKRFDAEFFHILPKVAEMMDPQQRLLMELSWSALEDSGYSHKLLGSNTGVYIGASSFDYRLLMEQDGVTFKAHMGTGTSMALLANEISYFYDFHGPSMNIDTACSSSLVALHTAVKALNSGECAQALVGGVNIICHPGNTISYYHSGMLSRDGFCKTFDADANGYVRSEGAVMLVLKPLHQAIFDKDLIHAVIKGTHCNHGGKSSGLTVPNPAQQVNLLQDAWKISNVSVDTINYIEAHGTGTTLGDPIEFNSLQEAFCANSDHFSGERCALGSIKSNIGHLEAAAGIVGLLKVVLSMKYKTLVASIHFNKLNPHIDLDKSPFYIVRETQPWIENDNAKKRGIPRRAGVSSFGSGGVNAHVVLEEYPREIAPVSAPQTPLLFVLSAKNKDRLKAYAEKLIGCIDIQDDATKKNHLVRWVYTLQLRQAMEERLAFFVDSFSELKQKLECFVADQPMSACYRSSSEKAQGITELFEADAEMQKLLHFWFTNGNVDKIVGLWIKGIPVSGWEALYQDVPAKISLPTYPFAHTQYWYDAKNLKKQQHQLKPNKSINTDKDTSEALVTIVGAGLFGICMAVALKKADIPFIIIEKNSDVGGVWLVNQWPGCGCDIPMLAYAYSFEHYKGDMWAKQPDILSYLKSIAEKYDLYKNIRFNTKVTKAAYQTASGKWLLTLELGNHVETKYFINAANEGLGHRKKMPNISGIEEFEGLLQHVVDCKLRVSDFKGKKLAIIGNGTTQVQLVEVLQPVVDKLVVYARSPKYIYPRANYVQSTIDKLNGDYEFWLRQRDEYLKGADEFYHVLNNPSKINPFHAKGEVRRYFNRVFDDNWISFYEWLQANEMVPLYSPGCNRPCMSHSYHKQIRSENVTIEKRAIKRITKSGIEMDDDEEHFDIILCATGYDLNEFKPFFPILGRENSKIEQHFKDLPQTYAGSCFSLFPNLFFGSGPNTSTNATSITAMYESRCGYFLELIQYCEQHNIKSIEIKEKEVNRFVEFVRSANEIGTFSSGCSSWYQSKNGNNSAIFPGTLESLKSWHIFEPNQYILEAYDPSFSLNIMSVDETKQNIALKQSKLTDARWDIDFNKERLELEVFTAFSEVTKLELSTLKAENFISNYGIDSIILVEFAGIVNNKFQLNLEAVQLFELKTLGDIVNVIDALLSRVDRSILPDSNAHLELFKLPSQSYKYLDVPLKKQSSVAIIGMGGIFPKSKNLEELWLNIRDGKDCITEVPRDRWDWESIYGDPNEGDFTDVKWGGFIDEVDFFDHAFFNISPSEANLMDPQHRLYLQSVYEAIEYSGHNPNELKGKRIAVYYSANTSDYMDIVKHNMEHVPVIAMQGKWHIFAPSRISYMLGLTGPCELIDTACSSSGVALKHAVHAILHDGCEGAIVGASNLMLLPELHKIYSRAGMLSIDGRCKTFSALANGYSRGEGVGVVYLKSLAKAEEDGDSILGVIRGVVENHGGQSNALMVPNVKAQAALIKSVFEQTDVDPRQVGLVECHGTGTPLGDPVEVTALRDAYATIYKNLGISAEFDNKKIGIGSIKSNIGHTEPLSGLAGLIKIVFSLRDRVLPKSLHTDQLNPLLKMKEGPFYVLDREKEWKAPEVNGRLLPRMAALSTFGVGNTNVHMLIEEYQQPVTPDQKGLAIFILSAKNDAQLDIYARKVISYLEQHKSADLHRFCYTFQIGRESMTERLSIVCIDLDELLMGLKQYVTGCSDEKLFLRGTANKSDGATSDDSAVTDENDYFLIAKLWVNGKSINWRKVFNYNGVKRLSGLPTYPFVKISHWVKLRHTTVVELSHFDKKTSQENNAKENHMVRIENRKMPVIALPDVLEKSGCVATSTVPKPKISLHYLEHYDDKEAPIICLESKRLVSVHHAGKGIVVIKMDDGDKNFLSQNMLLDLAQSFREVIDIKEAKIILLMGRDEWFLSGSSVTINQLDGYQALSDILDCEVPVAAVMKGHCIGRGLLLASVCDFVLCSKENEYQYVHEDINSYAAEQEYLLLVERFNESFAENVLFLSKKYSGEELLKTNSGVSVLPKATLEKYALEFADLFSEKSKLSLSLLKQHLSHSIQKILRNISNKDTTISNIKSRELHQKIMSLWNVAINPEFLAKLSEPKLIDIDSDVVHLAVYSNDVIIIRITDKKNKNTFSESLINGVTKAFAYIENNATVKVVVLTGYENYFCCGGSKEGLLAIQEGKAKYSDAPLYEYPLICKVPVIAAMQGHGFGAGWSLGLFCDLPILSEESVYSTTFMTFGFTPGFGSTLIFPERLGKNLGSEALFTAQEYKGSDLKQRGINLPVLPRAKVLDYALQIASQMAIFSREELIKDKNQRNQQLRNKLADIVKKELFMHEKTFIGNLQTLARIHSKFQQENDDETYDPVSKLQTNEKEMPSQDDLISIQQALRNMLAKELHMSTDAIDDNVPFVDIGLDSITGVMWIREINKIYGLTINATKIYNYPTLALFSNYILTLKSTQSNDDRENRLTQDSKNNKKGDSEHEYLVVIRQTLRSMLSEELHLEIDVLDEHMPFIDLGLDSITGVMWIRKLNKRFNLNIKATKIYSHPSLIEFSDYVLTEMKTIGVLETLVDNLTVPIAPSHEQSETNSSYIGKAPLVDEMPSTLSTEHDQKLNKRNSNSDRSIAIIGMSGQFPMANTLDEYWDNIVKGRDCISIIPKHRWDIEQYYDVNPQAPGKTNCRWMGVLDNIACFDPLFFNLSPLEAELMDPQQRLLLQNGWHCIEDAGYGAGKLSGTKCGVYIGCGGTDYGQFTAYDKLSAQGLIGSSMSIFSARMSYLLNLNGPCLSIDTACSSSLVAIAAACDSLILKNSDIALAGGSWTMAGPAMHIMTSKAGMLSEDGRCFTFDERANGFVPGEGVGIICLKRLADAERDGDLIHGVIVGWGVNHDGKTNGITAPNPDSQANLEMEIYNKYAINPEHIQLIEAHGTGTKLGDPVEVEALTKAFKNYTKNTQYCALGSVKSNIGHLLTAAGVAGVIKLLLSMKNKIIPPTINFSQLNEHIDLENSPFYVSTEAKKWEIPDGTKRCSAISSFGFGGTNAHMVIEEYVPKPLATSVEKEHFKNSDLVYIVLSAKNEMSLTEYSKCLLDFIEKNQEVNLFDLAYTLQVSREAMNARLGFVVDSVEMLKELLKDFITGKKTDKAYIGHSTQNKMTEFGRHGSASIQLQIQLWFDEKKSDQILAFWVNGGVIDWRPLYSGKNPRRVSVPNYPFAKEYYWKPELDRTDLQFEGLKKSHISDDRLHPLLHRNRTDFLQQRFGSVFTKEAFFLKEHQVLNQSVLPGVIILEMALEAFKQSLDEELVAKSIQLKNIVWSKPIAIDSSMEVYVELSSKNKKDFVFQIHTDGDSGDQERTIYSQGEISLTEVGDYTSLPLTALRIRCSNESISAQEIYVFFKKMGIDYGPRFQGITNLYFGDHEALAKIEIPSFFAETFDHHMRPPIILDAVLQVPVVLDWFLSTSKAKDSGHYEPLLPFALESMEIIHEITTCVWAWVRLSSSSDVNKNKIKKFDIDLFDDKGNLCVRICSFVSRVLEQLSHNDDTLILHPVWQKSSRLPVPMHFTEHHVYLCDTEEDYTKFCELAPQIHFIQSKAVQRDSSQRFTFCALEIFEYIQSIISNQSKGNVLFQVLLTTAESEKTIFGLSAMLKTAHLENPKFLGQIIAVNKVDLIENKLRRLKENSQYFDAHQVRYKGDVREVLTVENLAHPILVNHAVWKNNGVYLITGGAGGLGLLFAKEIVNKNHEVILVLTGRTISTTEKELEFQALREQGATVIYRVVDVSDEVSLGALVKEITSKYGEINGIIHSAGVIKDNFILKKSRQEFEAVLLPKVAGIYVLDQATKFLDSLDFFCCFSSVAGYTGNIGQSDYAAANGYMDAFIQERRDLVEDKKRSGKTFSINWPLWQEGGMTISAEAAQLMEHSTGMRAMDKTVGIEMFYLSLAAPESQIIIAQGNVGKLLKHFTPEKSDGYSEVVPQNETVQQQIPKEFGNEVIAYFKQQFSNILKIPIVKIDEEVGLDQYGIDSIMIMKLTNELEKIFGTLSKTLFFEYQTIVAISNYFLASYHDQLVVILNKKQTNSEHTFVPMVNLKSEKQVLGKKFSEHSGAGNECQPLDIAIVGLSGRYPEAENLDTYWKNLQSGKNCIVEVPEDRWDWKKYYSEDVTKAGRHHSKWGGFIKDVDKFDPLFFNISPHDAELMDPQERLFLEHTWMALEDGGFKLDDLCDPDDELTRQVGVYVGVMSSDYALLGFEAHLRGSPVVLGGGHAGIANRVSYVLNLHGPSMSIDTMCSSSLTTFHMACQDLKSRRTHLAIVGGVNISIHPNKYSVLSAGQFISSHGICESFGKGGNGYVPAEGVGVAILKRLSDAQRDRDHIYGVIKGSAINHGGKTNGIHVPNPNAQSVVIAMALKEAQVDPRAVNYIEAHGTGTKLGDPIEITGLNKVYGSAHDNHCWIGSVKSNIGHCESAAGIAAVSKILLQMRYKQLVPSLHSKDLNPNIDFTKTHFTVNQYLRDWPAPMVDGKECARVAGISSFGAGGSNAHLIIEACETDRQMEKPEDIPIIIVLSAKRQDCLMAYLKNILEYIERHPEVNIIDLAYTLQIGRESMDYRFGVIAETRQALQQELQAFINGADVSDACVYTGHVKKGHNGLAKMPTGIDSSINLDACIQNKNYDLLVHLWVNGLKLNWNRIYTSFQPKRISAPTYPFAKERYWIESAPAHLAIQQETNALDFQKIAGDRAAQLPKLLDNKFIAIKETWQPVSLDSESSSWSTRIASKKHYHVLVISQAEDDYNQIQTALKMIVKFSQQADVFDNVDRLFFKENNFTSIQETLQTYLFGSDAPLVVFLFLSKKTADYDELEYVFTLVQSFMKTAFSRIMQFYCIYQEEQTETVLFREGLSGFFKSAMLEGLDHRYRTIAYDDFWLAQHHKNTYSKGLAIIQEWLSDDTINLNPQEVPMVRYSGGERLELRINEMDEKEMISPPLPASIFKDHGTYLMLGALGGVGELICRELGKRFHARLIVFSRRSERMARECLLRMQESGASVIYRSVDISDINALTTTISELKKQKIVINGVFHLARSISEASIIKKDLKAFFDDISNKVQGTLNIDRTLADEPLDFFFNYSSMAAFGSRGLADYAYATAFQNAMARYRNTQVAEGKRFGRTVSICWGPWGVDDAFSQEKLEKLLTYWQNMGLAFIDVSMAMSFMSSICCTDVGTVGIFSAQNQETAIKSMGLNHILHILTDEEKVFNARILAFERNELSEVDFANFVKKITAANYKGAPLSDEKLFAIEKAIKSRALTNSAQKNSKLDLNKGNLNTSEKILNSIKKPIIQVIKDSVERVLKIPHDMIEVEKTFQEYGLDSITAMQLATILEKELSQSVPTEWFIEHPGITDLEKKLAEV